MKYNIDDIKRLLTIKRWNYSYKTINDWFFPNDLIPYEPKLKYSCKKLHEKGLLERTGENNDRWGFMYRIPKDANTSNIPEAT